MAVRRSGSRALRGLALLLLAASLMAAHSRPALAQGALQWVEVELALDGDGRAAVTYQARWRTSGYGVPS